MDEFTVVEQGWTLGNYIMLGGGVIFLIVLAIGVLAALFTVEQQTMAIIQRFGKFLRIASPGLGIKIPLIDQIAGEVSLKVQQLNVKVETKTADNVFVNTVVSVQYFVLPQEKMVYEAFYKLTEPEKQITAFVFDVVRAKVPQIELDDVFEKKDEIADAVKEQLSKTMEGFGYGIVKALVTDIEPDGKVKAAMNDINAAKRERVAAEEKGEAERILKVKAAQAEAESKKLQGEGIANQRKAIIDGLKSSIKDLQDVTGGDAREVMSLVLLTQYFDALKDIGASSRSNTILLPHSPGGMFDIAAQMRDGIVAANQVGKVSDTGEGFRTIAERTKHHDKGNGADKSH